MTLLENPLDYLKAFLGGIGISFTPCVYPLVPIVLGYIGVKAGLARSQRFILSFAYVSGVAVTYAALGLLASLTGKIFGAVTSHPLTYIAVGLIIAVFGLAMLGIFALSLAGLFRLPQIKRQNYFSAFFLGLVSGLIVGPCTTPALGAILLYLATKRNLLYGAGVLFVFAYGMGLLLIVIGTFSSVLTKLPKSGRWSAYIEKIGGIILVGLGIYFIYAGIRRF